MSDPSLPRGPAKDFQPSDAERQLEGRAEVLAAARQSLAEWEKRLSGWGWRRGLTRGPESISTFVAGMEALEESLARVRRRATLDAWPEETPVLRLAREVAARRDRLRALARRRLRALGVAPRDEPLATALTRLATVAGQTPRWELHAGEVLVFEAEARWSPHAEAVRGDPGRRMSLFEPRAPWRRWLPGSGRMRLTSERLLWRSAFAEPRSTHLDSMGDEGLRLVPDTLELRANEDWGVLVRRPADASNLAALVELVRWAPLRQALRAGRRSERRALFPARLGGVPGHCILGPEQLCFISRGTGPHALGAITGGAMELATFDVDRLVDLLRWLPDEAFDSALDRVLTATHGRRWSRSEVFRVERPVMRGMTLLDRALRLECGHETLWGYPKESQEVVAEGLLLGYPRRPRRIWSR
ncbi:hypothetical protein LZ198_16590 [Myxococcus sp. K15C18031901]|uniref:hypothetical protein n=1 Tax=Myxococcus dinghuensis TaxID=2906761 RepID=UPI0020A73C72|nr:hypothetical protein [Myxococcus dinghuensis]MCP3100488.1 hypothetical protein [Myxococcus dinghuensis]